MKRVGLALSGGIARGPAHLGVLAVLEREGVPIDCLAGVSAGSVVGALYCAGVTLAELGELLPELGWRLLVNPVWPQRGFVSFDRLEDWLIDLIGDPYFAQLRRPLAVVATDVETREPVLFRTGRVVRAVHASSAVPGLVTPVEIEGRWYADGGATNNLPAAAARRLGPGLGVLENYVRRSGGGLEAADVLISPDLSRASYFRFDRRAELMAMTLGVRAAEARLPQILAALEE